jgi:DNA-binding MarR family transcriptional regulator
MEGFMNRPCEAAPITDDIGFLLSRVSGLFARATNEVLAGHGLRVRSYSVLLLAADADGGLSQRELADVLGLDPSQVVLLVDDLTAAGLVERHPSPADRRTKLVAATSAGRIVRDAAAADVGAVRARKLASLAAGEQRDLHQMLSRLLADGRAAEQA